MDGVSARLARTNTPMSMRRRAHPRAQTQRIVDNARPRVWPRRAYFSLKLLSVIPLLYLLVALFLRWLAVSRRGDCDAVASTNAASPPAFPASPWDDVGLNRFQIIGTHNSYHSKPSFNFINAWIKAWKYAHQPIPRQLDNGFRVLELDTHTTDGQVQVYHLAFLDEESICRCLTACLSQLKKWSLAHPGHFPIFVLFDPKNQWFEDLLANEQSLETYYNLHETAIRSVFPDTDKTSSHVLKPDHLLNTTDKDTLTFENLSQMVLAGAWPRLGDVRGKIIFSFMISNHWIKRSSITSTTSRYYDDDANSPLINLKNRWMFLMTQDINQPYSAIVKMDCMPQRKDDITEAITKGFIVRTLADEGLFNNPVRWENAVASGCQLLSGDSISWLTHWQTCVTNTLLTRTIANDTLTSTQVTNFTLNLPLDVFVRTQDIDQDDTLSNLRVNVFCQGCPMTHPSQVITL